MILSVVRRFLVLCLALGIGCIASTVVAQTNDPVVAIVLGEKILLGAISSSPTSGTEGVKQALPAETSTVGLTETRARRLLGIVEERLFGAYAKQHGIVPSDKDLAKFTQEERQTSDELRSILAAQIAATKRELAAETLGDDKRRELTTRLRILESHPSAGRTNAVSPSGQTKEFAMLFLRHHDVNHALFREYGGRVSVSSLGYVVAVDARKRFFSESEQRNEIRILDLDIRRAFWRLLEYDQDKPLLEGKAAEAAFQ